MKRYFRDFYGCRATIAERRDGAAVLTVYAGGKRTRGVHKNYAAARSAMRRMSDGWVETTEKKDRR